MTANDWQEMKAVIIGHKNVGGYHLGDPHYSTRFNYTKKPSAWHRFWVRALLGWKWEDDV